MRGPRGTRAPREQAGGTARDSRCPDRPDAAGQRSPAPPGSAPAASPSRGRSGRRAPVPSAVRPAESLLQHSGRNLGDFASRARAKCGRSCDKDEPRARSPPPGFRRQSSRPGGGRHGPHMRPSRPWRRRPCCPGTTAPGTPREQRPFPQGGAAGTHHCRPRRVRARRFNSKAALCSETREIPYHVRGGHDVKLRQGKLRRPSHS